MRGPIFLTGMVFLTASCDSMMPDFPRKLVDGCYYAGDKPIFKVMGEQGQVLIPGDVVAFRISRGGNPFHAYATFSPGFLFHGDGPAPSSVAAYGARTYSMKAGTSLPTVEMHWTTYGDEDVSLGPPC